MIEAAKRIIKNAVRNIQKKAGLHVYRPVANAEKWSAWLVASGVPNPVPADQMRVTIMQVLGDVQVIPSPYDQVVYSTSGVFCRIGGQLCFAWYDYGYYDRQWAIREIANCDVCCHHRAVVVLSEDPGDFEFSDDALLSAPVSLVLDAEATESMADNEVSLVKAATSPLFTPSAAVAEKAKSLLRASLDNLDADPMQQAALHDLSHGKPVLKSQIADDLGPDLAEEVGLGDAGAPPGRDHREPVSDPAPVVPGEVDVEKTDDRTTAKTIEVVKRDTSRRTLVGWASVSTLDGQLYEDLHGDTISVDALHDICELIVREGENLGGVEHESTPNVVSAAMVIDDKWAAAMSDNFYFEGDVLKTKKQGLLIDYHYRDPADWEKVADSPVEFSINGTAFIADKQE